MVGLKSGHIWMLYVQEAERPTWRVLGWWGTELCISQGIFLKPARLVLPVCMRRHWHRHWHSTGIGIA